MRETLETRRGWRILRRILIAFAVLITLTAVFYTEEDLRGWRAWQKCQREFEARGFIMDWDKLIPPPVPDDENFFAAPKMQEWFVRSLNSTNDLARRLANPKTSSIGTTNEIVSERDARDYLAWSDQFAPDFDLMREALKRPYARMDGDYRRPVEIPIPNFVAVRSVAQTLAQRAHCHFLLNQPGQALDDLTLIHNLCRLLQGAPTGKPMTLVAAMINVAVAGLYADTIAEGFRNHVWQEPQLVELQKQSAEMTLIPFVLDGIRTEPVSVCRSVETSSIGKVFLVGPHHENWFARFRWYFWPRGWTYQNLVNFTTLQLEPLSGFDVTNDTISPRVFAQHSRDLDKILKHKSPYKLLAAIATPNFTRAWQVTAHNQSLAYEAQIACALERFKLAQGAYPDTLDMLAPQFIETIPHDIIGGEPLHYRRTDDGKFLLYSIGWNERDDGGKDSPPSPNGGTDYNKGDWVWKN
jgi:hypothetical protein